MRRLLYEKKKKRLEARGYPKSLIKRMLSEASLTSFAERQSALKKQTKQTIGQIMLTTYHPVVKNVKQTLMQSSSFSTLLIFHSPYSALRIFSTEPHVNVPKFVNSQSCISRILLLHQVKELILPRFSPI